MRAPPSFEQLDRVAVPVLEDDLLAAGSRRRAPGGAFARYVRVTKLG